MRNRILYRMGIVSMHQVSHTWRCGQKSARKNGPNRFLHSKTQKMTQGAFPWPRGMVWLNFTYSESPWRELLEYLIFVVVGCHVFGPGSRMSPKNDDFWKKRGANLWVDDSYTCRWRMRVSMVSNDRQWRVLSYANDKWGWTWHSRGHSCACMTDESSRKVTKEIGTKVSLEVRPRGMVTTFYMSLERASCYLSFDTMNMPNGWIWVDQVGSCMVVYGRWYIWVQNGVYGGPERGDHVGFMHGYIHGWKEHQKYYNDHTCACALVTYLGSSMAKCILRQLGPNLTTKVHLDK